MEYGCRAYDLLLRPGLLKCSGSCQQVCCHRGADPNLRDAHICDLSQVTWRLLLCLDCTCVSRQLSNQQAYLYSMPYSLRQHCRHVVAQRWSFKIFSLATDIRTAVAGALTADLPCYCSDRLQLLSNNKGSWFNTPVHNPTVV